jgi:hypothetical protein
MGSVLIWFCVTLVIIVAVCESTAFGIVDRNKVSRRPSLTLKIR